MRKILLATSVFALSVGIATAQSTGSVTPSPATPSTTTGTSQGNQPVQPGPTSTQPGTTSTQTGTTSTTGSGSMGTLQTTQPGSTTSGNPSATQGTPGVAGSAGSVTGGTQGSAPKRGTSTTVAPCTPSNSTGTIDNCEQHAFNGKHFCNRESGIALPARLRSSPRRQHQLHARAERQQLLLASLRAGKHHDAEQRLPRAAQLYPAILLHRAIWARDLQLSHRNRLLD